MQGMRTIFLGVSGTKGEVMSQEMECMCQECGASSYLLQGDIVMQDPYAPNSKLLDSLLVCQICGGQLVLVGKAGDEPFYRTQ